MKLKTFLILLFLSVLFADVSAVNDTIILNSEIYTEKISADLDSLVSSWYVRMAIKDHPEDFVNDSTGTEFPDTIYKQRLIKINSIIKLPYNSIIRNHIHVYTIKQRKYFSAVLGLRNYYFPVIEDIFDSYGLPAELNTWP